MGYRGGSRAYSGRGLGWIGRRMLSNRRCRGGVVAMLLILDSGEAPDLNGTKNAPWPHHKTLFIKKVVFAPMPCRCSWESIIHFHATWLSDWRPTYIGWLIVS